MGRWRHHFGKYADTSSTREREGCIFGSFHPDTHFQKSAFSVALFSGSMWPVGQNDAIHVRFRMKTQKSIFVWTASKPSLTSPVFEEKVLVVAGGVWGSHVEQCWSCCARFDESRQRRKLVTPFLCKGSSSVLTCLVFLRSSDWQDLMS